MKAQVTNFIKNTVYEMTEPVKTKVSQYISEPLHYEGQALNNSYDAQYSVYDQHIADLSSYDLHGTNVKDGEAYKLEHSLKTLASLVFDNNQDLKLSVARDLMRNPNAMKNLLSLATSSVDAELRQNSAKVLKNTLIALNQNHIKAGSQETAINAFNQMLTSGTKNKRPEAMKFLKEIAKQKGSFKQNYAKFWQAYEEIHGEDMIKYLDKAMKTDSQYNILYEIDALLDDPATEIEKIKADGGSVHFQSSQINELVDFSKKIIESEIENILAASETKLDTPVEALTSNDTSQQITMAKFTETILEVVDSSKQGKVAQKEAFLRYNKFLSDITEQTIKAAELEANTSQIIDLLETQLKTSDSANLKLTGRDSAKPILEILEGVHLIANDQIKASLASKYNALRVNPNLDLSFDKNELEVMHSFKVKAHNSQMANLQKSLAVGEVLMELSQRLKFDSNFDDNPGLFNSIFMRKLAIDGADESQAGNFFTEYIQANQDQGSVTDPTSFKTKLTEKIENRVNNKLAMSKTLMATDLNNLMNQNKNLYNNLNTFDPADYDKILPDLNQSELNLANNTLSKSVLLARKASSAIMSSTDSSLQTLQTDFSNLSNFRTQNPSRKTDFLMKVIDLHEQTADPELKAKLAKFGNSLLAVERDEYALYSYKIQVLKDFAAQNLTNSASNTKITSLQNHINKVPDITGIHDIEINAKAYAKNYQNNFSAAVDAYSQQLSEDKETQKSVMAKEEIKNFANRYALNYSLQNAAVDANDSKTKTSHDNALINFIQQSVNITTKMLDLALGTNSSRLQDDVLTIFKDSFSQSIRNFLNIHRENFSPAQ